MAISLSLISSLAIWSTAWFYAVLLWPYTHTAFFQLIRSIAFIIRYHISFSFVSYRISNNKRKEFVICVSTTVITRRKLSINYEIYDHLPKRIHINDSSSFVCKLCPCVNAFSAMEIYLIHLKDNRDIYYHGRIYFTMLSISESFEWCTLIILACIMR